MKTADKCGPEGRMNKDRNRINLVRLAGAALLAMALTAGCGPIKSAASPTPVPIATTGTSRASLIVPEESLPPLPGVMSGGNAQPEDEEKDADDTADSDNLQNP